MAAYLENADYSRTACGQQVAVWIPTTDDPGEGD